MKQVQTVQPTDWMRVQLQASHEGEPLLYKGETKIVDTDDENVIWRNQWDFTGTPLKFKPAVGGQTLPNITETWHSITVMKEYLNRKSFEELRLEDYVYGRVNEAHLRPRVGSLKTQGTSASPIGISVGGGHPFHRFGGDPGFVFGACATSRSGGLFTAKKSCFSFGNPAGDTQTHTSNSDGTTCTTLEESIEGHHGFSDKTEVEESISMSQIAYSLPEPTLLQSVNTTGSGEQLSPTRASSIQVAAAADESTPVQQQRERNELLNALFYTQLKCLQIQQSLHQLVLLRAEQLQATMNSVEKGPVSSVSDVLQKPFDAMAKGSTVRDDKKAVNSSTVMSADDCSGQTLAHEDVASAAEEFQKPLEAMLKTSQIQVTLHQRLFSLCTEYMVEGGVAIPSHVACNAQVSHDREVLDQDTDEILAYAESQLDGINFKQSLPCTYYRDPFQACKVLANSSDKLEEVKDFSAFTPADSTPTVRPHIRLPHGQGVLATQTGQVLYDGQWRDGKRFGKGKAFIVHATDGLILDKKKSGYYEGQWRENMRHGKGRMVFLSSASYEGRWQYDAMEGNGCLLYPDGCSQEGEWTKGLIDGRGLFTWPDGMMEYREYTMGEARRPSSKMDPGKEKLFQKNRNVESRLKYAAQTVHGMREELYQFAESANSTKKHLMEELDSVRSLLSDTAEEHARKLAQAERSFSSALKEEKRNLEKQLEAANVARLCQICFENNRDCIIMPCTHMLFCRKCVASVKLQGNNRCPSCRGPISGEINCNLGMES